MWFPNIINKIKNKSQNFFKNSVTSIRQFRRLLGSYWQPNNYKSIAVNAVAFTGIHCVEFAGMWFLTRAQNQDAEPGAQPGPASYGLVLANAVLSAGIWCLRFALIENLRFSLENHLKKDLLRQLSEHKTSAGVDFVQADEQDITPMLEMMGIHAKQFGEGAVVVSAEFLSTMLSMWVNIYGAKRLSNSAMSGFSVGVALGVALLCHRIADKKSDLDEKHQENDMRLNVAMNQAEQNKEQIVALKADSSEYVAMQKELEEKEKTQLKMFGLNVAFDGTLSSAFVAFPILLKVMAPLLLSSEDRMNSARLDMFATQMLTVMAYVRDLLRSYTTKASKMSASMKVLFKLQNSIDIWTEFYTKDRGNAIKINFDSKCFGFSNLNLAIPFGKSQIYTLGLELEVENTQDTFSQDLLKVQIAYKIQEEFGVQILKDIILLRIVKKEKTKTETSQSYFIAYAENRGENIRLKAIKDWDLFWEGLDSEFKLRSQILFSSELRKLLNLLKEDSSKKLPEIQKLITDYVAEPVDSEKLEIKIQSRSELELSSPIIRGASAYSAQDGYIQLPAQDDLDSPKTPVLMPAFNAFTQKVQRVLNSERLVLEVSDLQLEAGKVYRLCGASGDGKSTIIKALVGMWPFVEGEFHFPWAQKTHADKLVYLPQDPLIPGRMTLLEAIAYPRAKASIDLADLKYLMKCLGLKLIHDLDTKKDSWQHLSRGERQRLAILRVLLKTTLAPGLVLLDEATASIDRDSKRVIELLLKKRLPNTTILFVDHQPLTEQDETQQAEAALVKMSEERKKCLAEHAVLNLKFSDYEISIQNRKLIAVLSNKSREAQDLMAVIEDNVARDRAEQDKGPLLFSGGSSARNARNLVDSEKSKEEEKELSDRTIVKARPSGP
ncbi:MAG: ATP-binding cassette domain-containing protein [Gammaproteobacteria bacterium]